MCIYFENEGIVLNDRSVTYLLSLALSIVSLLSFCLAKNESSKEKNEFSQSSACQNGLYSVDAVRLSAACAEIIATVWGLFSLSMRGGFYFLLWVLLSCLRQKLRRNHGLGDSALMDLLSNGSALVRNTNTGGIVYLVLTLNDLK